MNLISTIIKPSPFRKPFFDGDDTMGLKYEVMCTGCGGTESVGFKSMLDGAWGWENCYSKEKILQIKEIFDIGPSNKSPDGGWPSIIGLECKECDKKYLVYVGFNEYMNSVYRITEQGLVEIEI